jgi:hypothetical protein
METNITDPVKGVKFGEMKTVMEKSNAVFDKLKGRYNALAGYLVFSSNAGQCELTTDVIKILKEFPAMFADSRQKEKAIEIMETITALESDKKKSEEVKSKSVQTIEKAKSDLSQITNNLEVRENTFVEIRFKKADLDLIFELQKDELVSREHTPQTKASIRIVLGTIGELR